MNLKKFGVSTILGLLIATIGIIMPIIWDYYKTRSAIELQYLSSTSLIKVGQTIDNLTVLYNSKKISNLTRTSFALVNTGRLPIHGQDIVAYPQITFNPSNEILEFRIDRAVPPELGITHTLDIKKNKIEISFPLLNQSDRIEFSVLVSGVNPKFNASARISGIRNLQVIDKTSETGKKHKPVPWTVFVVGPLTLYCIFLIFSGIINIRIEQEQLRLWEQKSIIIQNELSAKEINNFIEITFKTTMTKRVKNLIYNYINAINIPKNAKPNSQQIDAISREINKIISVDIKFSIFEVIVVGVLASMGIWHLIAFIIQYA